MADELETKLEISTKDIRQILVYQEDIIAIYPHSDAVKKAQDTIDIMRKILGFEVKISGG